MVVQREFKSGDRILVMKQLRERVPFTPTHIYRLIQQGEFPKQVRIGANRVGWLESEITAWLSERVAAR